ncbi:MAG: hypothetical protein ACYS8W_17655 [Planctomycetota bacterium]|jgi:hypothetical protein
MDQGFDEVETPAKAGEQEYKFAPCGLSLQGDSIRRVADENVVADISLEDVKEIRWNARPDLGCIFISILMLGGGGVLGYFRYSETWLLITAIVLGVIGLLGIITGGGSSKIAVSIKTTKQKFDFGCSGNVDDWKAFLYEIDKHARTKGFAVMIMGGDGDIGIDL